MWSLSTMIAARFLIRHMRLFIRRRIWHICEFSCFSTVDVALSLDVNDNSFLVFDSFEVFQTCLINGCSKSSCPVHASEMNILPRPPPIAPDPAPARAKPEIHKGSAFVPSSLPLVSSRGKLPGQRRESGHEPGRHVVGVAWGAAGRRGRWGRRNGGQPKQLRFWWAEEAIGRRSGGGTLG